MDGECFKLGDGNLIVVRHFKFALTAKLLLLTSTAFSWGSARHPVTVGNPTLHHTK